MAEYLDSIITEYYSGSAWVDISAYVVSDITGNNGLGGWKPDQRVAVLGMLNITLNNKSKLFSPMGGDSLRGLSTLTGFNKGSKIRIRGIFDGDYYTIWSGRIANIDSDDLNWGNEQARLTAFDWMQIPVNYPMQGATIALNKRIDEAMTLILARLSLQPEATDFDTGSFTFPAIFDNVKRKTMALSEFTKLANSELSYIYVQQDGTLRVENFIARHGWRALDTLPVLSDIDSFLLQQDGFFILQEDSGKLILNEVPTTEEAEIVADAERYNILLPEDGVLNASIIRASPVITDTSLKVLYKLGTPLFIPVRQTFPFSAHYTDPNGLLQVSGTNMQAPVATTDYLANTAADGSGTNKTADVVVTATYYGDTVYYSIANNASAGVYITFLQARGYGIYYANSVESNIEDDISQAAYGYTPFQFDQKYQKDTYLADMIGKAVIEEYKNPKSRITKMKYLANLNNNHMMAFLILTIGSLISGTEDRSNISNHYYITDRSFVIKQGGIINVEYGVKQNDSYLSGGLNPVTVEFSGGTSTDSIDFGNLPQISNFTSRGYSAWIYADAWGSGANDRTIIAAGNNFNGFVLYLSNANKLRYIKGYTANNGEWETAANPFTLSAWHHILITHDYSAAGNNPLLWIDGVAVTLTQTSAPATTGGVIQVETGVMLQIGNNSYGGSSYADAFDGKIYDPRILNMANASLSGLTLAQALYNSGVPSNSVATDGTVFQGNAVYADQGTATSLAGHILISTDRVVENALRAVGIPHGAPVIRANP